MKIYPSNMNHLRFTKPTNQEIQEQYYFPCSITVLNQALSTAELFYYDGEGNEFPQGRFNIPSDYLFQKALLRSDTAPTIKGLYPLSETGVYNNLGGIDAQSGKLNFASFDGTTWSKVEVAIRENLAQTTGQSTNAVMSQKAVTDEIIRVDSGLSFLNSELTSKSVNLSDNIFTNRSISATNGTLENASNNWLALTYQNVPANSTIRIKGLGNIGTTVIRLAFKSSDGNFIESYTNAALSLKTNFTILTPVDPDGKNFVQVAVVVVTGVNVGADLENSPYKNSVMISVGDGDYPFAKKGNVLKTSLINAMNLSYAYLSPNGDDVNGDGSFYKPLKTTAKARSMNINKFILLDGVYESNNLDMTNGGEMHALNSRKAVVRGSSRIVITSVTLERGDIYKADMGIGNLHVNNKGVWIHDIPDNSTIVASNKRLPYLSTSNYRLSSTRIKRVYSMTDLTNANDNACFTDGSSLYIKSSAISSVSAANPIVISDGQIKLPSGNSIKALIKGLSMEYMSLTINSEVEFDDCSLMYATYSGFKIGEAKAIIKNCRIGGVDNNGIGYDGVTQACKGLEINNLIHDCKDQGSSAHGMAEVYRENCLFVNNNEGVADVGRTKSHFVGCAFLDNYVNDIRFTFSGSPNDGNALIVNCSGNAPTGVSSAANNSIVVMNCKFTGLVSNKATVI